MRPTSRRRRAFGVPTLFALALPLVIFTGAMALSSQSSAARRFSASLWRSTVGLELAEAAIAEAAHFVDPETVFAAPVFGRPPAGTDITSYLLDRMCSDRLDGVDAALKEYRTVRRLDGSEAARMLVAFRFPPGEAEVQVPGVARALAAENPGINLGGTGNLVVTARPLSFRREYRSSIQGWVNWGVVQFRVRVRVNDLSGTSTYELKVDRRFTLRPASAAAGAAGNELIKVSSLNLRTTTARVD